MIEGTAIANTGFIQQLYKYISFKAHISEKKNEKR
jgi:hypothetical protein